MLSCGDLILVHAGRSASRVLWCPGLSPVVLLARGDTTGDSVVSITAHPAHNSTLMPIWASQFCLTVGHMLFLCTTVCGRRKQLRQL